MKKFKLLIFSLFAILFMSMDIVSQTPPATWQEHWFEHNQLLTRVFYDNDVAIYYDIDVSRSITWPNAYLGNVWRYTKSVYGSFGSDPHMFAVFHTNKYSGGHPSTYFDASHDYRNVIDVGPGPWTSGTGNDLDLTTHEVAHIVEGACKGIKNSPAFGIWGDSKWAEIFNYDVYRGLGRTADATRWYNLMIVSSDNFPRTGTFWFRDWFYPIWSNYGGSAALNKYFQLLSQYFPKSGTAYSRDMNWGEFIHFWSGAAGADLQPLASTAFGWSTDWQNQLNQARISFPFSYSNGTNTDITNSGGTMTAQYSDSPTAEVITKLIDNLTSTKYLTFHASAWVQYQAPSGYIVTSYTMTSANDAAERDPLNWTLQGSNNGTTWTTIDTRSGIDFPSRLQKLTFSFTNTTSYAYYRLNMTNNSGTILQLAELELFGVPGTTTIPVTGVTMSPTTASISVAGTQQLTATVAPTNATNMAVTWTTSNSAVATVSASGLVTGIAAGSATITVTTTVGSYKATCAVTVTPFSTFTTTIQAESYSTMAGIATESTTDAGGGLNVGWIEAADWMAYPAVTIPIAGTYTIEYRVASMSGGGSLQFELAGGTPIYGTLAVPSTGGWQTWTTIKHTVTLSAGSQSFAIKALAGGWNINWFAITQGIKSAQITNGLSNATSLNISAYPNPASDMVTLTSIPANSTITVFDLSGQVLLSKKSSAENGDVIVNVSYLKAGAYFIKIENEKTIKLLKR